MAKLLSITQSKQYQVTSSSLESLIDKLRVHAQTLTKDDAAKKLGSIIDIYLPVLSARIDKLTKRLTATGRAYTYALYQRRQVQTQLSQVTDLSFVTNLYSQLSQYEESSPSAKLNWSGYTGGSVTLLNEIMTDTTQAFYSIFKDATEYTRVSTRQVDFYSKYAAHLQSVQNRLSNELDFLLQSRNTLAEMRKILVEQGKL